MHIPAPLQYMDAFAALLPLLRGLTVSMTREANAQNGCFVMSTGTGHGFRFGDLQREVLQAELSTDAYPDYGRVADMVGEERKRVMKWFRDNRHKLGINTKNKRFTAAQVRALRREADEDDCPNAARIARIAQQLGETKKRIKLWFVCERKRRGTQRMTFKRFTEQQVVKLKRVLDAKEYPTGEDCQRVADLIHDTKKRVQTWFQTQRKKLGINKFARQRVRERYYVFTFEQEAVMSRLVRAMPVVSRWLHWRFLRDRLLVPETVEWRKTLKEWWEDCREDFRLLGPRLHYRYRPKYYSLDQLREMVWLVWRHPKPDVERRRWLTKRIGVDDKRIVNWCYNRRITYKYRSKLPRLPDVQWAYGVRERVYYDLHRRRQQAQQTRYVMYAWELWAVRLEHERLAQFAFRLSIEDQDQEEEEEASNQPPPLSLTTTLSQSLPPLRLSAEASRHLTTEHMPRLAATLAALPPPPPPPPPPPDEEPSSRSIFTTEHVRPLHHHFHQHHLETYARVVANQQRFSQLLSDVMNT